MKKIFSTLLFLVLLVPASMAWNVNQPYIYFDNTTTNWATAGNSVHVFIGHSTYSYGYKMTPIEHTNLFFWHKDGCSWGDMSDFRFACTKGSSEWGEYKGQSNYNRLNGNANVIGVTDHYGKDYTNWYLFSGKGTSNYCAIEPTSISDQTKLNKTVTVKIMLSCDGGNTYAESGSYYGTIKADRFTFSADHKTSVSQSQKTLNASSSYATSALSAMVTFTQSETTDGYTFMGWGASTSSISETDNSWSYFCGGDATVYAFYAKSVDLSISSVGYASYYGESNLIIPEGLTVTYITAASTDAISWSTLSGILPKQTGVILQGTPGTYTAFTTTASGAAATGNLLKGTATATVINNSCVHYVLANGAFGVGLYYPNEASVNDDTGVGSFTNGAHKAYLELSAGGSAPRRIIFAATTATDCEELQETQSAIKTVRNGQLLIIRNGNTYNTQGQLVK